MQRPRRHPVWRRAHVQHRLQYEQGVCDRHTMHLQRPFAEHVVHRHVRRPRRMQRTARQLLCSATGQLPISERVPLRRAMRLINECYLAVDEIE